MHHASPGGGAEFPTDGPPAAPGAVSAGVRVRHWVGGPNGGAAAPVAAAPPVGPDACSGLNLDVPFLVREHDNAEPIGAEVPRDRPVREARQRRLVRRPRARALAVVDDDPEDVGEVGLMGI
jgi:hypothetical protein